MADEPWSRREIGDAVRGALVVVCDATGGSLPVPGSLAGLAAAVLDVTVLDILATAHPDDRGGLARWFIECTEQAGPMSRIRARVDLGTGLATHDLSVVNLLDDPALGAMLAVARYVGPADPGDPGERSFRPGEHDEVAWMLGHMDPRGYLVRVEGKVRELLGRSADEVVGHMPLEFMPDDSVADVALMWRELIRQPGNTATSRRVYIHPDGTELWTECVYLHRPDGGVLMLVYDISDRRAQEEALLRSHEEIHRLAEDFRLLADEVPAAVFRCDGHGTVTFHNARWGEVVGDGPAGRLHDVVHPDDRPVLDAQLAGLVADAASDRRTVEVRAADGGGDRVLAVTLRSDGEAHPGGDVADRRIVGSIDDVTATVRLRHEARRDELTGLLNRKALEEALAGALGGDRRGTVVVFLDLDGFKEVNDVHGHDAGDVVLREVARRLSGAVRPGDTLGRYGGDEFMIVCAGVAAEDATALRRRLDRALAGEVPFPGGSWSPAASIGTARPEPGDDPGALVRRADLDMFAAKQERRRVGRR
jgi:diguanylate cyclase (GGDEF)-like protein/PAS domain S-box-containing protein